MAEAPILSPQTDSFLAAHPPKDGWKVYQYDATLTIQGNLRYLLDCLRDRHPEALKRRFVVKDTTDTLQECLGKTHVPDKNTEWDLRHDLDSDGWTGLVEIEWRGHPIHYYSYDIFGGMHPYEINLVATKSNSALTEFQSVVEDYGRKRAKAGQRKILVVNGPSIPAPNVSWDEVILPPGMLEEIRTNVDGFFKSRERYQHLGIPYRRGFLFTGSPGCGKTLTLKAMASTLEATIITMHARAKVEEGDVEYAFYLASKNVPAVLLFEDLDKLVQSEHISLSYFLNILDGLKVMDGVLVIATSNDPGKLDPALLHRPSRFDRVWRFSLPKYEQRLALLERKGTHYFSKAALEEAAQNANGFSMAYVQEIIVNALLECAHANIVPSDPNLLRSVETLKKQRKSASKEDESLADRENLGFSPSPKRGVRELLHSPDGNDGE